MNNNNRSRSSDADALEAFAAFENQQSSQDEQPVEEDAFGMLTEAAQGMQPAGSAPLAQEAKEQEFLQHTAQVAAQQSEDMSMLGSAIEEDPQYSAAPGTGAAPQAAWKRAAKLKSNTKKKQKSAFRKTMIPLLAVVGGLLLLMCITTIIFLCDNSEEGFAADGSNMRKYGKYFVLTSLPTGSACLLGAWQFYQETRPRKKVSSSASER